MKNFRQILSGIDVAPLLGQIEQNPQLWNIDDAWTKGKVGAAIYETDNIVLRYNKSSRPGLNDWDKPAFAILNEAQKIIFDVMRAIPGEHLGKVVITRLRSGDVIEPHIDRMPPGFPIYFQRFQIPLAAAPGVTFHCGDEHQERDGPVDQKGMESPHELAQVAVVAPVRGEPLHEEEQCGPEGYREERHRGPQSARASFIGVGGHRGSFGSPWNRATMG